jgi:threonine aldolase
VVVAKQHRVRTQDLRQHRFLRRQQAIAIEGLQMPLNPAKKPDRHRRSPALAEPKTCRTLFQNGGMAHIELRSDNTAGVAPEILAAVVAANTGSAIAYGADALDRPVAGHGARGVRTPGRRGSFPVTSGTAANALALSAMCPPWGAVLCHETAHILNSEAAATSMMGAACCCAAWRGDDHRMQPDDAGGRRSPPPAGATTTTRSRSVISFTQPTDMGTIYRVDEVGAAHVGGRARPGPDVPTSTARASPTRSWPWAAGPADLTWRAGIDVVSLGATKNGALSAEAIVSVRRHRLTTSWCTARSGPATCRRRCASSRRS